ncbi:Gfo/Idh/MocA family oxidoreductase [Treponema parvum]|uniref:Gfo/Idh/MocA family oxidoreductase n=1 Tax=Treponema parvum TaxID=138851 RepID=A0A975IDN4_9SPIR|nr:Gfo/Idh/MocA family oxidoreductase [Treponema parvum]QTQ13140.1 Gfo/Idh/MocA family oxidoreductase [Treponema parvum]
MKKKGFGIIGLGMISEFHAKAIEHIDGARLIAGFDPVPGKAGAFAQKHGCMGYENLADFLNNPEIDIVTIATPSGLHLDGAVASAKAGKHVIVEKPLEVTPERCKVIIDACKKNKVKLTGVFPSRYHDASRIVKKAIESGRFGKIAFADAQIKWCRSQEYYDSGAWRGTWKMDGGGCLMNQGIHAIDLLQWFMGPVKEVSAFIGTVGHKRIEVEDTAAVALKFANGAVGTIEGTTCAYPGFFKRIEIMGTEGTAVMEEENIVKWEFSNETDEDERIRAEYGNATLTGGGAPDPSAIGFHGHQRLFESFINAVDTDSEPDITGESASRAVEIICAAYKSARLGKKCSLPLERK